MSLKSVSGEELTTDVLIGIGRGLLDTVGDEPDSVFNVKGERMTNLAHVPTVHALTQHSLRLGGVVLDLYERGLRLEAMPTVRSLYEFAVTAQWASDSREGISAMFNEDVRQRRALARTMSLSASQAFREFAPTIPHLNSETIDTIANAQGRHFEARCLALRPVGNHGYALYRSMSAYCHPSASLADHYMDPSENEAGATLKIYPEQFEHDSWLFIGVASMTWAARAFDVMRSDHPHRSYLREVARRLGIPDVLRLTDEARQAELAADQGRRQAEWKGPRRRRETDPEAGNEKSREALPKRISARYAAEACARIREGECTHDCPTAEPLSWLRWPERGHRQRPTAASDRRTSPGDCCRWQRLRRLTGVALPLVTTQVSQAGPH